MPPDLSILSAPPPQDYPGAPGLMLNVTYSEVSFLHFVEDTMKLTFWENLEGTCLFVPWEMEVLLQSIFCWRYREVNILRKSGWHAFVRPGTWNCYYNVYFVKKYHVKSRESSLFFKLSVSCIKYYLKLTNLIFPHLFYEPCPGS